MNTDCIYRSVDIRSTGAIDEDKRTVELAFSSEEPVKRWDYTEILDHSASSVQLSRISNGGALLVNHDTDDQVGVVESCRVDPDKKCRAVVRFGTSERAKEIFQDVVLGIRRLVSVGYRVLENAESKTADGMRVLRAMRWEPLELSIVPIPADTSVGVGRSDVTTRTTNTQKTTISMSEQATASPALDLDKLRNDAINDERNRVRDILAIADIHKDRPNVRSLADKAVRENMPVDTFRHELLTKEFKAVPVATGNAESNIPQKELRNYSLLRAIAMRADGKQLDGLEREVSDEIAKQTRRSPEGFYMPMRTRELKANVFTAAGALVDDQLMSGDMIQLLRNNMAVAAMGARQLSGLVGNVAIPRQTGGATAYWLAESASTTASTQAVDQVILTPKRLSAYTAYTKELLAQSSIDIESFVRNDIMQVLAIARDLAALEGSSASGQPMGLVNVDSINLVTFTSGLVPTFLEMISMESAVAADNALQGSLGYLVLPTVRGALKGTAQFSGGGTPIWVNDTVNGYKAMSTAQLSTTSAIFGNWSDLMLADWAGTDVVVDPYSLALTHQIRIVVNMLVDNAVRHPQSFCMNNDAA